MKKLVSVISLFSILILPNSAQAVTPNDPLFPEQWYLQQINAPQAWEYTTGSPDIIVAVLDSGIDIVHEDLFDNLWTNENESYGNNTDDDGNGYIDDYYGYDFVLREGSPLPVIFSDDENMDPLSVQHGTISAGIISAIGNNGLGITGVSWNSRIMALRVLAEDGNGYASDIAEGIYYAVHHGARIINLSFSGESTTPALNEAIRYAYENDVIVVAAVGNNSRNINESPSYPACINNINRDWLIAVTASDKQDTIATFSNFGVDCVDIAAPGVDMTSLAYYDPQNDYDEKYLGDWQGTSFAAPVVSGAIALLLSEYPWLTPSQVQYILQQSTDPLYGPNSNQSASGRLNIASAFEFIRNHPAYQSLINDNGSSSDQDEEVDEQVEKLPPPEELIFIKTEDSPTVYLLTETGRRVILNEATYKTYLDMNHQLRIISADEMSSYRLEGLVLPRAERVLVKIQSNPMVYWLDVNQSDYFTPLLRPIPNESIAEAQFGENWSDYIIDIDPTMYTKFGRGEQISDTSLLNLTNLMTRFELSN